VSSPTLAEFLAARLDEDEAWVRNFARLLNEVHLHSADTPEHQRAVGAYMFDQERLDPGQLLREVEAKRAILAEHRDDAGTCYRCRYGVPAHWESVAWPCPTIRALAAVWRDHPDYSVAWSPDETMRR
jgi:hypothetical protein